MGAAVASIDGHPYWCVSRISAILAVLALFAMNMLNKNKATNMFKYGITTVLVGLSFSPISLPAIKIYEASMVANRSYGRVVGSIIIILLLTGLAIILSKVKHLTRPFSGHSCRLPRRRC
jgi:Ca2+/H+ antiporter